MPKSKRRPGSKGKSNAGGLKASPSIYPAAKRRRDFAIFGAAVVLVIGYLGYVFWQDRMTAGEFDGLLAEADGALSAVETLPNLGQTHLRAGEIHNYADKFPTSGPHEAVPTSPGLYDNEQRPTGLVHALEHGSIVIYYEQPAPEVMAQLEAWAKLFTGTWDGVVVAPMGGLGSKVVMTAWRRKLELPAFDPATAAAFVDAYRGRGPENPVR